MEQAGSDTIGSEPSISRRAMVKRGAAAGAVALWITPTVQIIGLGRASAQSTSAPTTTIPPVTAPPTTSPPSAGKDISNIQIVVRMDGRYYGLKYDGVFDRWSSAAPDSNDCIRYFEGETDITVVADGEVANAFNSGAVVDVVNSKEWRLRLPLPSGYTYVQGYLKAGNVARDACSRAGTTAAGYVAFVSR